MFSFVEVHGQRVLVSKCLLGHACQYDGTVPKRRLSPWLIERLGCQVVAVCPEELAGLPTPRQRMEIVGGDGFDILNNRARVMTCNGRDKSREMLIGAMATLDATRRHNVKKMIVRRRSPSCSNSQIADGTFTGNMVDGVGIAVAMIRSETNIDIIELENVVQSFFSECLRRILKVYRSCSNWRGNLEQAVEILRKSLPPADVAEWHSELRSAFQGVLPSLHEKTERSSEITSDSDTARFFQEVILAAWGCDLLDPNRRCRMCTYPEGFLDTYILHTDICSSCTVYHEHESLFKNYRRLRTTLRRKLNEVRGRYQYDAIAACSGGKDSTYMMLRLRREYGLNILAVTDNLNQLTKQAKDNIVQTSSVLGVKHQMLSPIPMEREIRRNFLMAGNSFCRLCLRSHFTRIYEVALREQIPLIFFGLSPYQCLDCVDSINWSLQAIFDVATPLHKLDCEQLLRRYKHRTFQGGFELGFVTPSQKDLYHKLELVFSPERIDFAPLIVPFFLFDGYQNDGELVSIIVKELGWKKPNILLNRTDCRLLRLAGIMHRAVGRFHLNYKERATQLRLDGILLTNKEIQHMDSIVHATTENEQMSAQEFNEALYREFGLTIGDLPEKVRVRLKRILF